MVLYFKLQKNPNHLLRVMKEGFPELAIFTPLVQIPKLFAATAKKPL